MLDLSFVKRPLFTAGGIAVTPLVLGAVLLAVWFFFLRRR